MPDEPEKKRSLPKKFFAGFAVGAVLSFGLCGAGILNGMGGDQWWGLTATIGAHCFYACMAGLVVSAICWAVSDSRR
jgi:formate/nitrite transporter FocA (FNT family)